MGKARIKCERIDQKMNKEMTSKFFEALTDLEKENNIGSDILIEKIKSGIEKAIKKDYPYCENIRVDIDPVTGKLDIRILKEVMDVMYVDDPDNEIFLDEAKLCSGIFCRRKRHQRRPLSNSYWLTACISWRKYEIGNVWRKVSGYIL